MQEEEKEFVEKVNSVDELEKLTSLPETIEFEGKEYRLFPLDLDSMAELRKWAKKQIKKELNENLTELGSDLPVDIRHAMWKQAAGYMEDPLISPAMESSECITKWVFLCLKKGDTSISESLVKKILDKYSLKDILQKLMSLNGVDGNNLGNSAMVELVQKRRDKIGKVST